MCSRNICCSRINNMFNMCSRNMVSCRSRKLYTMWSRNIFDSYRCNIIYNMSKMSRRNSINYPRSKCSIIL